MCKIIEVLCFPATCIAGVFMHCQHAQTCANNERTYASLAPKICTQVGAPVGVYGRAQDRAGHAHAHLPGLCLTYLQPVRCRHVLVSVSITPRALTCCWLRLQAAVSSSFFDVSNPSLSCAAIARSTRSLLTLFRSSLSGKFVANSRLSRFFARSGAILICS